MYIVFRSAVEFIGMFVVISIVLGSKGNPFAVVVALALVILIGSLFAPVQVNPAISLMAFLNGSQCFGQLIAYVGSQLLGAVAAVLLHRSILRSRLEI